MLSLPPVLRVPVVFRLHIGPEWKLKAVIKDPEGKLAIALWQGEQVLIHVLGGREFREQIVTRRETALSFHAWYFTSLPTKTSLFRSPAAHKPWLTQVDQCALRGSLVRNRHRLKPRMKVRSNYNFPGSL